MIAEHLIRIGHTRDQLGESPVWDDRSQSLYWIDSLAGLIRRLNTATGTLEEFQVPAPIGSMALRDDDGAILALRNGFARYDFESRKLTPDISIGIDHPEVRLNDGKVDPYGRFVAGTLHGGRAEGQEPLGGLYRLDASGALELLETNLAVTNGPCFSLDGKTFYLADSPRRVIWAYDYDEHSPLRSQRVFVDTASLDSGPDGATVDAEGYLWSVLVRVGAIARFAPDGTLVRRIDMPIRHPTSVAFGGLHLDTLYVTSISRSTNLADNHPDAGGLFAIEGLGVKGLSPQRFVTR
jgi:L-arabinonolactonase